MMMMHLGMTMMVWLAGPVLAERTAVRAEVTVASFNAWLLPLGFAPDSKDRRAAMPAAIAALDPDILCLQEVWGDLELDPLAEGLRPHLPELAVGAGGLAIMSRWPIRFVRFEPFPDHDSLSRIERLGGKGYLVAVVETPAGPLRVVDTHLAHGRAASEGKALQLATLTAALAVDETMPTVLCGDLNVRGGDPALGALARLGFRDLNGPARVGTRGGWPRSEGRPARSDPDYLMVRDGRDHTLELVLFRQALDTPATALSDHNLQLARLILGPAHPPAASR